MSENILLYQKTNFNGAFFGENAYTDKKQPIVKRTNAIKSLFFEENIVNTTLDDGVYEARKGNSPTSITFNQEFEVRNGKVITILDTTGRYVWTQQFLDDELKKGTEVHLSNQFGFNVLRSDQGEKIKAPSDAIDNKVNVGTNEDASEEIAKLFNSEIGAIFDYAKPVSLLEYLIKMVTYDQKDSIILDFFSGSATTAHAVMELNVEDGGNRKYIMVQLPEESDSKEFKNICEIGKERIRRAGKKIKEENPDSKFDDGFRVLRVDSSNMKDVYHKPEAYNQSLLDKLESNIKEDRNGEDLLFQTMLSLGIDLSSKIEKEEINDNKVLIVEDGFLISCFDEEISENTIEKIAKKSPYYAVFSQGKMSDSTLANFEQIFDTYSTTTIRKVL